MDMGCKVKIKMPDGTKRKGVIIGLTRDPDPQGVNFTLETIQVVLEPLEIER